MIFARLLLEPKSSIFEDAADKKLFSPRKGGRIALSANERIAEFLDFAIQAKFAYVNKLRQGGIRCPPEIIIHTKKKKQKIRKEEIIMQAVIETIFDAVYLVSVITIGILMIRGSKGSKQFRLFGLMAVVLGAGDSFHLIPRALALCTTGLENYTVPLGLGKWITSVTMTVFYVLLYYVWRQRYQIKGKSGLTASIYLLSAVRVVLCMMPQNQWLSATSPLSWGIYRNIPFALLGLLIIVLFYRSAKEHNDAAFRWMWLTIVLSFGFYIPVVLWADIIPMIGMLMIPKTCAYVWTVLIGFFAMKKECK